MRLINFTKIHSHIAFRRNFWLDFQLNFQLNAERRKLASATLYKPRLILKIATHADDQTTRRLRHGFF